MSSSSINWGIHWDTDSITNHTIHLILWQAASSIIAAHLCHCPLLFSPVVPVYIIKMHVLINITFLHVGEGLSSCNNHSLSQLRLSCACCLYNATTWGTWFKIINIVSFCLLLVMIIYFKLLILKLKDNIIVSSIPGVKMIPFPPYKAPQTPSRLPSPTKTGYSDF